MDAYFRALGYFVHRFSETERAMQWTLWVLSGVTASVGRAVFSGVRIGTARDFIKRIFEATNPEEWGHYEEGLKQLTEIIKARDDIMHYGAGFSDQQGELQAIVGNDFIAHTPSRVRRTRFSPETVLDMAADLGRIEAILIVGRVRAADPQSPFLNTLEQKAHAPWRYKPDVLPPLAKSRGRPPQ